MHDIPDDRNWILADPRSIDPKSDPDAHRRPHSLSELTSLDTTVSLFGTEEWRFIRHYIKHEYASETAPSSPVDATLKSFDFARKLLLRFGYTAYTHLDTEAIEQVAPPTLPNIRRTIINGLKKCLIAAHGDVDCGSALAWLANVTDKKQHFGDIFDRHLKKSIERARSHGLFPLVAEMWDSFWGSAIEMISAYPDLETTRWMEKQRPGSLAVNSLEQVQAIASKEFRDELRKRSAQDEEGLKELIDDPLTESHAKNEAEEQRDKFANLRQLHTSLTFYTELQLRSHISVMKLFSEKIISEKIIKYFRGLAHSLDKGKKVGRTRTIEEWKVTTTRTIEEWKVMTGKLCDENNVGILYHYTSVWNRMRSHLEPTSLSPGLGGAA